MFNLIVTGMDVAAPRGSLTMQHGRVFQHTDKDLENRYAPGGVLDTAALMALPTILTNESSSDPDFPVMARVGKITKIRRGSAEYQVEYELSADVPPIANSVLESLAAPLHFVISKRFFDDFQTNHWAVKDADLFRVLFTESIGRIKPTIFKLPEGPVDPKLVAVMMPFNAEFTGVHTALQAAVGAAGMRCLRADNIWDDDVIIQDVVKLIGTARAVICDLTGKNANVFYEAGIAHTMGQDVILIAQHESDIPFDLRHIRHIKYLPNEQGLNELAEKVSNRLATLVIK
ncbi:hypothetical protein [Polaromonas sp. JS666]|uniref:hypothetical protein n=1 Tax=Polaromonas sp. (strain JS666 / ATCC BAA-500) TaxID=296591 RepID=UPI00005354CF|nr:hypothetical protein [Polaromonas sp. JS666]ABE46869.1 hypothetical protein Bpro_4997 [Polaromonas sp. JS666]